MRTIKFRGKRLDNGEWMWGGIDQNLNQGKVYIINYESGYSLEIDPSTVGQSTGLFDKNGKEIYEGDVVKSISGSLDVVSYDEIAFNLMTAYATAPNGMCVSFFGKNNPLKGIEVVGNIHDNPELLTEK